MNSYLNRIFVIGMLALVLGVVGVGALANIDSIAQLENEISDAGYDWLINYSVDTPRVLVFTEDGNETLIEFNISEDGVYKEYLTNLNGSSSVFDLLVLDGAVEFDYIVDPTSYNLSDGLVGYWRFNNDASVGESYDETGNDTVVDYSVEGNNGTALSSPWESAVSGNGLEFDGVDDYVAIPDLSGSYMDEVTISYWYSPRLSDGIYRRTVYLGGDIYGYVVNTAPRCKIEGVAVGGEAVSLNTWHYVVCTANSSGGISLYQDGILKDSDSATLSPTSSSMFIGSSSSLYFNGSIDDVQIYNCSLNATEIEAMNNTPGYVASCPPGDSGAIVGHWALNESGQETTASDSSGNGNDGTLNNFKFAPDWGSAVGKDAGAFTFDGVDDYVDVADDDSLEGMSEITLTAWVNPKEMDDSFNGIIAKTNSYYMVMNYPIERGFQVYVWGLSNATTDIPFTIPEDEWSFVSFTYNSSLKKFYINGNEVLSGASTGTVGSGSNVMQIGLQGGNKYFNGTIDEVRIYNRSLSPEEISILYNNFADTLEHDVFVDNVTECSDLNETGAVYLLNNNVSSTGTCMNILADNVTLDCQGYEINYSYSGTVGYGVNNSGGYDGVTVKNCVIKEGTATTNNKHAIYFNGGNNATIDNCTIEIIAQSEGIYFDTGSDSATIINNNVTIINSYAAALLIKSNSNNISHNILSTSQRNSDSIYLISSSNNYIINNTMVLTDGRLSYGISFGLSSDHNIVINNTINSVDAGIIIGSSTNNSFYDNKVNVTIGGQPPGGNYRFAGTTVAHLNHTLGSDNLADGLPVNYTFNVKDTVYNNIDFSQYGQVIFAYANNITINNSNLTTNGLDWFMVTNSTISNNNITATRDTEIAVDLAMSSNSNIISDNIITTSASHGYGIKITGSNVITSGNKITTSGDYGYCFYFYSDSSTISNSTCTASGGWAYPFYFVASSNNNITNVNTTNSGRNSEVRFDQSENITLDNVNILATSSTLGKAFTITGDCKNFVIINSNITSTGGGTDEDALAIGGGTITIQNTVIDGQGNARDIYVGSNVDSGSYLIFINTTFNKSDVSINDPDFHLNVSHYVDVYTNNSLGNNVSGANVSMFNSNNATEFTVLTDANGNIATQTVQEYMQNQTGTYYYTPHSMNITGEAYSTFTNSSINVSDNIQINAELVNPAPATVFVSPTAADGTTFDVTNIYVNATGTDTENISTFIDFDNSLVSWWRMDDYNSTTVHDYTGRNNGTIGGDASYTASGKMGGAFEFDGVGDYVEIVSPASLPTGNDSRTISVWVNTDDMESYKTIIFWGEKTNNKTSAIRFESENTIRWQFWLNDLSTVADIRGGWHNIVVNYDNSISGSDNRFIYLDGQNIASDETSNVNTSNSNIFIGTRIEIEHSFNGSIDDVMIFNRSLSATEIANLYANQSTNYLENNFTSLSDAAHTVKVYSQDLAGNVNYTTTRTINTDTTYPNISFASPTLADGTMTPLDSAYVNVSSADNLGNHSTFVDWNRSLVLWMRMDDVNQTGVGALVYDNSSYGNNGTAYGNAVQTADGKLGKGFTFDGDGDYVDLSNIPTTGTTDFSISAWIKKTDSGIRREIVSYGNGVASQALYLFVGTGNKLEFDLFADAGPDSSDSIEIDTWYFITVTHNSGTVQLYLNGLTNGASDSMSPNLASGAKYIGQDRTGINDFNGSIDDVMIWDRALSPDEISSIYNAQATQYENNFTNLSDGDYTYTAYTQDLAGQVNSTSERTITVDSNQPATTLVSPTPATGTTVGANSFIVNVTATDTNNISTFIDFDNSLVSWWRMDDYNSTTVHDYTGRNNGTIEGDASYTSSGKMGGAFEFDGSGDYVEVNENVGNLIGNSSSFSMSVWIKPDQTDSNDGVLNIGDGDSSTNYAWDLQVASDVLLYRVDGNRLTGSISYTDTTNWAHVVMTYNGTEVILYKDGINVKSSSDSYSLINFYNYKTYIGLHYNVAGQYNFNGSIDDVMIFNRSLSATEIANLYANQSTNYLENNFTSLSDAAHTVKVYSQDLAGNVNYTTTRTINTDTTYPNISFASPTLADGTMTPLDSAYVNVSSADNLGNHSTFVDWNRSLVLWMRMDDVNQTGVGALVYDNSSYGNNGTAYGNAVQTADGKLGKGFTFDGDGDYIDLGDGDIFNPGISDFSVSTWVKFNSKTNYDTVWGKTRHGVAPDSYALSILSDKLYFWTRDDGDSLSAQSNDVINVDEWYHVMSIRNSSVIMMYLNGIKQSDTEVMSGDGITSNTYNFIIGATDNLLYNLNGSIDDVMIWNRALSPDEISSIYNAQSTQYENNFTNLSDGDYTYTAYTQDLAGQVNSTSERTITVDSNQPATTLVSPTPATGTTVGANNLIVNVTATDTNNISTFIDFDNSLVSWWRMDDYNSTAVHDYMGRNNGTIAGDASYTASGKMGGAFEFDGDGDWVDVGDDDSLEVGNNLTLSLWIKANSLSGRNGLYNGRTTIDTGTWMLEVGSPSASNAVGVTTNSKWNLLTESEVVSTGIWYHLVYSKNGTGSGKQALYVNGVSQTLAIDDTIAFLDQDNNKEFGTGRSINNFNGSIDDVMIFNRSLSPTEIANLYANQSTNYLENNFTSLADGNHTVKVYSQDLAGNVNYTETRTITTDTVAPTTTLNLPIDHDVTYENITFNCSAVDSATTLKNITLYHNQTGTWTANQTNTVTELSNSTTFSLTSLSESTFIWNCYACDNVSNCAFASANRTYHTDQTNPGIEFDSTQSADGDYWKYDWFEVKTLVNETHDKNTTIYLYNSSGLVASNTTTFNLSPYQVGYWSFDNDFKDYSDFGNDGTNYSDVYIGDGYLGGAAVFDGAGDYITAGTTSDFSFVHETGVFTYSAWINLAELKDNLVVMGSAWNSDNRGCFMRIYNSGGYKLNVICTNGTAYNFNKYSTGTISEDEWQLVTVSFNGTQATYYINGDYDSVHDESGFTSTGASQYGMQIGGISPFYFNGSIDEVRIFNKALTSSEITQLYNLHKANFTNLENEQTYFYNATTYDLAGNTNSTETRNITIDTTAPWNITLYDPTPAHNVAGGEEITLNWTVRDNLDTNLSCYANVDGTDQDLTYTTNGSFASTATTLSGGYRNISVQCYDDANNSNVSEYRTYIVGLLNVTSPASNTIYRPGETITLNVSIDAGELYINNLTAYIDDGESNTTLQMTNTSVSDYNVTYTMPSLSPRYIDISVYGHNNNDGPLVNITTTHRVRLARNEGNTSTPTMSYYCSNETYTITGRNLTLMTTFDLDTLLEDVNITVNHPESSTYLASYSSNITDEDGSSDYTSYFNYTLDANVSGTYVLEFTVRDIENQTHSQNTTVYASASRTVNWSSEDLSNIELNDVCTGAILENGSSIEATVPSNVLYNIETTLSDQPSSITFTRANMTNDTSDNFLDYNLRTTESEPPEGQRRVAMFDLENNSVNFDNFTFIYNYSSFWYTLTDESNLNLYRCVIDNCVFEKQSSAAIDSGSKILTLTGEELGRYLITEPALAGDPEQYDAPEIVSLNISKTYLNASEVTNITLHFNIALALDSVNLTVNGTAITPHNTTNLSSTEWIYYYNYSNPSSGSYLVEAVLLDENTFNDTESKNIYVVEEEAVNISSVGGTNLTLRDVNSGVAIHRSNTVNGTIMINTTILPGRYNVELETPKMNITAKNSTINSTTNYTVLTFSDLGNAVSAPTGVTSLDQFEITSDLDYSSVEVVYDYTDLLSSITKESDLDIYKCENSSSCTLAEITTTIDEDANTIRFNVSSLSVFVVGESFITETETVTVTTSGGGGGGATKYVSFELVSAGKATMELADQIVMPLLISNPLEGTNIKTIKLSGIPNTEDLSIEFDKDEIDELKSGENESVNMLIDSHSSPGDYEIKINATAENPAIKETTTVYIRLVENLAGYAVGERVVLAQDLFKENPQCLEFGDYLIEAERLLESDPERAKELVNYAIQQCKDQVTSQEWTVQNLFTKFEKNYWKNPVLFTLFGVILALVILIFILRKRARGKYAKHPYGNGASKNRGFFSRIFKGKKKKKGKPRVRASVKDAFSH